MECENEDLFAICACLECRKCILTELRKRIERETFFDYQHKKSVNLNKICICLNKLMEEVADRIWEIRYDGKSREEIVAIWEKEDMEECEAEMKELGLENENDEEEGNPRMKLFGKKDQ